MPWPKKHIRVTEKISLLTSKLILEFRKKLIRCYDWSNALNSSETWTLWKLERIYLKRFETWYWRRIEEEKWLEKVTNEEVLERVEEKRELLNNILRKKFNWVGHILRRNCLVHDAIKGLITEVKGVGRRRRMYLLVDLRNRRRYWKLKEEAEDRNKGKREFIRKV